MVRLNSNAVDGSSTSDHGILLSVDFQMLGWGETAKNSGKRKGDIWESEKTFRKQGLELDSEGQEAQEKEYL